MDAVDVDDLRHKEEERRRREKRKSKRESKSASQREKEAKVREYRQRLIKEQNAKRGGSSGAGGETSVEGGSSAFQALFTKRSEGFLLDFQFRNAPPRPPVGPCFVGYNVEAELQRWSEYRDNTIEKSHVYKLHTEADLGVPLACHAMILSNYKDPSQSKADKTKTASEKKQNFIYDEEEEDDVAATDNTEPAAPPPLHPDDEALLNWTKSMGDTAAEELQLSRDRKRAEAQAQALNPTARSLRSTAATPASLAKKTIIRRVVKAGNTTSRVLNEKHQSWMKKTTYLYNDPNSSVHKFTSLADTKRKSAEEVEQLVNQTKAKYSDPNEILKGFHYSTTPLSSIKHPTKKNLKPVAEYSLLPDAQTWGHTYTHVVIDNPPKRYNTTTSNENINRQLTKAFITDVEPSKEKKSNVCNLRIPTEEKEDEEPPSKRQRFDAIQNYDLDVVALKDESFPHVHFLLTLDDNRKQVAYRPILSRVQLSGGRPPSDSVPCGLIGKRPLGEEDVREMEMRAAEIDVDLASKYDD